MKLVIESNSWTKFLGTKAEERWLAQYLGYRETRWGRGPTPDTVLGSLLDSQGAMPTGLVPTARRGAKEATFACELNDRRIRPCRLLDHSIDLSWLRDYQLDAVQPVLAGASRGLFKAITGSGKTEIAIGLTRVLPCEHLMLVHRIDLVEQFAQRYQLRTGERAGSFTGGYWKRGTCNVTCASFQSIHSALKRGTAGQLILGVEGLLVDESHAQAANTLYEVTQAFENAFYRFGFSGTPLNREDKDSLRTIGALGPLLHRVPLDLLIDRGVLSPAKIRMVKCEQQSSGNSWRDVHKELVLKSAKRNALIVELCKRAQKPCLAFISQVRHGADLARMLEAAGLKVAFANGKDPLDRRQRKIRELVAGGTEVLLCTGIFQEGIDIPELRSVVNAAGGQSEVATIQRLGRGMRTCAEDGKEGFEMWEVGDVGQKWLQRHALARKASYESEGHKVEVIE